LAHKENKPALPTSTEALQLAKWDGSRLKELLASMHEAELAELLLSCRNDAERLLIIPHIPDELLGDTLLELPEGMQEDLLAVLNAREIEDVVEHLDSDDATDILQAVEKRVADEVMERLEPDELTWSLPVA